MTTTMTEEEARAAERPFTARYTNQAHNPEYCCASVGTSMGNWTQFAQCTRKPKVFYGSLGYCGQHDPVAAKKRRDDKYAAWHASYKAKDAAAKERDRMNALKADALDALKQIAAGHNDPRTLANEILDKHSEPTS